MSLALGIFAVYITESPVREIIVYPTPDNTHKLQFIDAAETCFSYQQTQVTCPANTDTIHKIPAQ